MCVCVCVTVTWEEGQGGSGEVVVVVGVETSVCESVFVPLGARSDRRGAWWPHEPSSRLTKLVLWRN